MQDMIRTVLVVEDEDGVRNLLRTLFRLAGFEVLSCQDGMEALDLMHARGGNVHLLVTDINLGPAMDGIELAESLRAIHPCLKTLYISGEDEQDRLVREIATGQSQFLMKPFRTRDLTDKALEILAPAIAAVTVSR
ncbi:MAG: Hybrid sensor histidine kinase [Fibrobacteres bacterium]|nr:Hybrid sensor histidine kinase [Fibrobacterota bacterium]